MSDHGSRTSQKQEKSESVLNSNRNGLIVSGSFRSQSGLTSCDFEIDFNDYGHITGKYWISSENPESSIPKHITQNICDLLRPFFMLMLRLKVMMLRLI